MAAPKSLWVKICCIRSLAEARSAIRHGADSIGFVSEMPSGPCIIPESLIAEILAELPPSVNSVLLTSRTDADSIIAQQRRCAASALQICDRLPPGDHARIRAALPGISLLQVIQVTGEEAFSEALELAQEADALLLDSGDRARATPQLGGTGRTHDWSISRRIREAVSLPVHLAGGLTDENVAEAIRQVRPFGVDVCTGVRSDGELDPDRLAAFMAQVRGSV